jgi:carbamoyl-phosphate synthase large subunit
MITILVSGASGILGYGILKSLKLAKNDYRLIGTTVYNISAASAFSDVVEIAPLTSDSAYLPWLCSVIKKHKVNVVIPGLECDMIFWNKNRQIIQEAGAKELLNTSNLINLCSDKWVFYQTLQKNYPEYSIPTFVDPEYDSTPTPFLLKPRSGYGSKGIVIINSNGEFEQYKDKIGKDLMIQKIVGNPSEEYTLSAFLSENHDVLDSIAFKRVLSPAGYTQQAEVVDTQEFEPFLKDMAKTFHPIGPTNFQFRRENDKIKLLEINPRISAATSIRASLGFNEADMSVEYFLRGRVPKKIDQSLIKGKKAIRYVEDIIL